MRRDGNIVTYTADELKDMVERGETQTDWARLEAMTDEEIEANADDEDEGVFDRSVVYINSVQDLVESRLTIQCDQDVVDWFKRKPNYPKLMNEALREYIRRHDAVSSAAD